MTRALDEACARAMGWTRNKYWHGPDGGARLSGLPKFATDPATDAEKVAWLTTRGRTRLSQHYEDEGWHAEHWAASVGKPTRCHGATMTEALARLCVAVDEAERMARDGAK